MGNGLEHPLVVLRGAQVDEHGRVYRCVVKCCGLFLLVIRTAHGALLSSANTRRYNQVEAELARLHLLLMNLAQGAAIATPGSLLTRLTRADVYLLQLATLITASVS